MTKFFFIMIMIMTVSGCSITTPQNTTNNSVAPGSGMAQNDSLTKLDLSGQQLSKVPDSTFGRTDIEVLDISNNQITGAIQAEIRNLQKLKVLDASDNLMTGVPAEIGQLRNLETLNLSNNQLTGLPYELGNLSKLKTLDLSGNDYSELDLAIIMEKLPSDVKIIK